MKIRQLRIQNFRGISEVNLTELGSMVIIAGQNGSGKSCLFDAIRLLKSVYGGYQANEWQQWMGEFQINFSNRSSDFIKIFNNPTLPVIIECAFEFSREEKQYIMRNAEELIREKIWRQILPEAYSYGSRMFAMFAAQLREREPEVLERIKDELPILTAEIGNEVALGRFLIPSGGLPTFHNSLLLQVAFSSFRSPDIGVIDYHGAQRNYGRENVQGINLNLEATEQQRSQTALYNYAGKYNNVKSEMASSYIKEVLANQAGLAYEKQSTLSNTLKELFSTFFPDKAFLGPQPTLQGALNFPVQTQTGRTHDLDELSAGEKEILYGYLRIRNSAPQYSIILLDEPELHLNPRLIRGLPQFYKKNLGEALNNQIWLVTHSDALLREVVGQQAYNVFHMLPCTSVRSGESQLKALSALGDLDIALTDLVGDLASYKPGSKVIILEGGGDSDFDQKVVSTLFPELHEKANLISGTNKHRVEGLLQVLDAANKKAKVPFKFYSINDRDIEEESLKSTSLNSYKWDVYHIENYFLEAKYIAKVIANLRLEEIADEYELWEELKECARETIPQMVGHRLTTYINKKLVGSITIGGDPKAGDQASAIYKSIAGSMKRITDMCTTEITIENIKLLEEKWNKEYNDSIQDGSWVKELRARDILRRYTSKKSLGVNYEIFRNLILSAMKDDGFKPEGMKLLINKIIQD